MSMADISLATLTALREHAEKGTGFIPAGLDRVALAKEIGCTEQQFRTAVYHLTELRVIQLRKRSSSRGALGAYRLP
jgi:hypothetical protein